MRIFDPERFALVDHVGDNLLLRGNMPLLADGTYAADGIRAALQQRAGLDLRSYTLINVALIDNVSERSMFEPLVSAFGVNPNQFPPTYWPPWMQKGWVYGAHLGTGHIAGQAGFIVWWPIEAPCGAPPGEFLHAPGWNLDGLVMALRGALAAPGKTAIYVHCTLGADRTGAAIGSYLIATRGLTGPQAIDAVTSGTPAHVAPSPDYQKLILDYAAQGR